MPWLPKRTTHKNRTPRGPLLEGERKQAKAGSIYVGSGGFKHGNARPASPERTLLVAGLAELSSLARMNRLSALFVRLIRHARRMRTFVLVFGPSGLWVWLRCVLQKRPGLAMARLEKAPHVTIWLRPDTSDVDVFEKVFVEEEYKPPFDKVLTTILDLGANVGLASVYYALAWPDARIVAVEPSPENVMLLRRNVAAFPNVTVVHGAAWSENGPLALIDTGMGPWAFRVEGTGCQAAGIEIEGMQVSTILDRHGIDHVDLLKMDIEGAEKQVFSTAAGWINRTGAIAAELHDRYVPGCSRTFFAAVSGMPHEKWAGENVFVWR